MCRVTWTPCNYGGRLPWFLCPRGGRRVAILYGGSDFCCRTCRRLTYETQRVPPASRSLARAQRLRVRLGGSVDMTQPFPARPKGMHFLSYTKQAMRAWRAEERANAETRDSVEPASTRGNSGASMSTLSPTHSLRSSRTQRFGRLTGKPEVSRRPCRDSGVISVLPTI
jgi:hypothetical protein